METLLRHLDELPIGYGEGKHFAGRAEKRLAKSVGITQFGVNQVTLAPGARTALRHWHEAEDEFVLVLVGAPSLIDDNGEHVLRAGHMAGFPAGAANAHHLVNNSSEPATLVVVGSRKPGEETVHYPDDNFGPIRK
ncbi:MAG: cupin domain-containing protein [Devosia sp.]